MKSRRLLGIAALGAAAASMMMVPGAHAQEASYAGSSTGRAFALNVGPEGITLGQTTSGVDSTPTAEATGVGVLNPIANQGETEASVAGADGTAGSPDETCAGDLSELPEIPFLSADLACSTSEAAITGGLPTATATARAGSLVADPLGPVLGPILDTPLGDVLDTVEESVVDEVVAGIDQVSDGIADNAGVDLGLGDTLGDLIDQLLNGAPLLGITLGSTESTTTVADGKVVTTCTAEGARIDILDPPPVEATDELPAVDLPPVLSLIIGGAGTSVTADTATGIAEGTVSPALVRIEMPSSPALDGQEVGPGETVEIPLPDPFGTQTIAVAGPQTGQTDDGQTFARASAVRIHLLPTDDFQGGLELAFADCQSVGGATVAAPPTTTTTQPPLLPRTGADGPNTLALASAIGFAGLGLALLRRTRTV